jgi:hypothetical protein
MPATATSAAPSAQAAPKAGSESTRVFYHTRHEPDPEELARACAGYRRWEFMLTVAPLVLERVTGSPVNPIALF